MWEGMWTYGVRGSENGADFKYFINFAGSWENGSEGEQLGHDTSHCPNVDLPIYTKYKHHYKYDIIIPDT
jgi:hypothetical protein